jgi:hypothetical protein
MCFSPFPSPLHCPSFIPFSLFAMPLTPEWSVWPFSNVYLYWIYRKKSTICNKLNSDKSSCVIFWFILLFPPPLVFFSEGSQERLYYPQEPSRTHEDRAVCTGVRSPPLHSGAHHGVPGERHTRDRLWIGDDGDSERCSGVYWCALLHCCTINDCYWYIHMSWALSQYRGNGRDTQ